MKRLAPIIFVSLLLNPAFGAKNKAPKKKKSVFVFNSKTLEIFDTYTYPASILPGTSSYIISESQGLVTKLNKSLGDQVNSNEKVIQIKNTDPAFQYRPVNLNSPIKGVVSKVYANPGSIVSKGQKLMLVTNPKSSKIKIEVTAKDLPYIKKGTIGFITGPHFEGEKKVVVKGIAPFVDQATGTASAELSLLNKNETLPIGTFGRVTFKSNQHVGFSVPQEALYYQAKKTFLRVVEDGKLKRILVKTGKKRGENIEIVDGLKEGQTVIKRASGYIPEGAEVEVKK